MVETQVVPGLRAEGALGWIVTGEAPCYEAGPSHLYGRWGSNPHGPITALYSTVYKTAQILPLK